MDTSLYKSDVEVLRKGTTSYEDTWANATPIYTG